MDLKVEFSHKKKENFTIKIIGAVSDNTNKQVGIMKKLFVLFILTFLYCGQAGADNKQLTTQEINALEDRDILLRGDGLLRKLNYERVINFADQILAVKLHNPEAYYWKGITVCPFEETSRVGTYI